MVALDASPAAELLAELGAVCCAAFLAWVAFFVLLELLAVAYRCALRRRDDADRGGA